MIKYPRTGSATMVVAAVALLHFTLTQAAEDSSPRIILGQAATAAEASLDITAPTVGLKPPLTEAEIGLTRETLSNKLPDWKSVYFGAVHRIGDRHTLYGGLRETERFGLQDSEIHGGLYYPLGTSWTSLVESSVSPTHQLLPRYSVFGQLQKSLPGGWGAGLGLRHSEYSQTGANIVSLLAERYWGNFRGAYTLYFARPEGASSASSHRFQLSYYYEDRSSIGLSYSTGREVENVGPPRGVIVNDVRNLTLSGSHWFRPNWALTYDLSKQEQGTLYRRQGLRLGIRLNF